MKWSLTQEDTYDYNKAIYPVAVGFVWYYFNGLTMRFLK